MSKKMATGLLQWSPGGDHRDPLGVVGPLRVLGNPGKRVLHVLYAWVGGLVGVLGTAVLGSVDSVCRSRPSAPSSAILVAVTSERTSPSARAMSSFVSRSATAEAVSSRRI